MQKKLMALAVAGALGAPALAFAQVSTVNIYGSVRVEYGVIDSGGTRPTRDRLENPGSSYIGFRGEEKLGGGLSAWFQCETNLVTDGEEDTFCSRNTGLGFKGSWGNFFMGFWDTPKKISQGGQYRPFDTTGLTGVGAILHNETTSSDNPPPAGGSAVSGNRASFHRRAVNSINYHSPVFSGLEFKAQVTTSEEAISGTSTPAGASHPRLWSLAGTYTNGPLYLAAAYEQHNDFGGPGLDDFGWHVIGAYTFAGVFRLGGIYERLEYETAIGAETRARNWAIYGDWQIQGPHQLRLGFTRAQDSKGNGAAVNSVGAPLGTVTTQTGVVVPAGNNGADLWSIMYAYNLSKRTSIYGFFSKLNNDSAGLYRFHRVIRSTGQDQDAFGFGFRHRF